MMWAGWIVAAVVGAVLLARHLQASSYGEQHKQDQQKREEVVLGLREDLEDTRASARRQIRSAQEDARYSTAELIKGILPVDDALGRALGASLDNPETYREGVELVRRQLEMSLRSSGAVPVEPELETRFDPHTQECVTEIPGPENGQPVVHAVVRRGWKLHDRLLRPAEVVLARRELVSNPDSGSSSHEPNAEVDVQEGTAQEVQEELEVQEEAVVESA